MKTRHPFWSLFVLVPVFAHGALWIDENALKQSIRSNPNDVQSKVLYARYLLEQDKSSEALEVLKGVDPKKNPSVAKLLNDIRQWNSDRALLKTMGIKEGTPPKELPTLIQTLSPQQCETLYYALERFKIPVSAADTRLLAEKIGTGNNKILAGAILSELSNDKTAQAAPSSALQEKRPSAPKESARGGESGAAAPSSGVVVSKTPEKQLQDALAEYARNPVMKNIEAVMYLQTRNGQEKEHLPFLKQHVRNYPFDYEARLLLGKNLAWNAQYDEALAHLYGMEGKHKYEARLLEGQIASWRGNYAAAEPLFAEVEQYGNTDERYQARKNRAFMYRWQGNNPKAGEIFALLNRENPSDAEVEEEVWFDQKRYGALIEKYEKRVSHHPDDPRNIDRLAYVLQLDGQYDKALFYREMQYALSPKTELLREMGNLLLQMKQTEKGLEYWQKYAEKTSTPSGWLEYAKNLHWAGKNDSALTILKTIREVPETSSEANELIERIEAMGKPLPGQTLANPPAKLPGDEPRSEGRFERDAAFASRLTQEGKHDQAARIYRMLYLKTSDAEYGRLYAQALDAAGKKSEAAAIRSALQSESAVAQPDRKERAVTAQEPPVPEPALKTPGKAVAGIEAQRLSDTDGFMTHSENVVTGYKTSEGTEFKASVGKVFFKDRIQKLDGESGFVSVGTKNAEAGVQIDRIDGRTDIFPYLRLSKEFLPHTVTLTAQQRNAGYVKNAIKPVREGNALTMIQLSDYALLPENREFWGAAEIGWDEHGNVMFTPQFQYRFYQTPLSWGTLSFSVDGWYLFNSKPTLDYYSPEVADTTFIGSQVTVPLLAGIELGVMGGLGYSVESEAYPYKYRGWLSRALEDGMSFQMGCSNHQSFGAAGAVLPYAYDVCDAKLHYRW